jgi:hypothetical protein
MTILRIIVANEPRAYRDVIAATFAALCTQATVVTAEPADLDGTLADIGPALVVCSRLTPAVEERTLTWIVLYADGTSFSEVSVAGDRSIVLDMDFDRLLAVVEQTELLVG